MVGPLADWATWTRPGVWDPFGDISFVKEVEGVVFPVTRRGESTESIVVVREWTGKIGMGGISVFL